MTTELLRRPTGRVYSTASSTLSCDQQIATCRISGVVTASVMSKLLADCQEDISITPADALIGDYSNTTLALDPRRLLDSLRRTVGPDNRGALAMPTALVVPHDDFDAWRSYAFMAAQCGILRGVFTAREQALAWVRQKAEVYSAMREYSRARRPGS